ncbi:MAG: hypothetical protein RIC19_01810 [Phaeodactylibacter sp.]|uniref:hypothetical protein n=1 Tax=Phaeodactylibacter sp. TaxID=1940289 RepID=UPI0032EB7334
MINNITFSTEMDTLYLIDNDRAIPFSLDTKKGILIGVLKGQLTVVTDFEVPAVPERIELADGSQIGFSGSRREVKLSTEKTVWSAAYHRKRRVLSFIGATEVEVRSSNQEYDYKPEIAFFELEGRVLNVQRRNNAIVVKSMILADEASPDR